VPVATPNLDFLAVASAEQAVERLIELYQAATTALAGALKRYGRERRLPSEDERKWFYYPELRLHYQGQDEAKNTVRAWGKVEAPGLYRMTVTQPLAFRRYLLAQLRPLLEEYEVQLEVGLSRQAIPYPYVIEQGDELAGVGVTAAELARVGTGKIRCRFHCLMRRAWISRSNACNTTAAATGDTYSRGYYSPTTTVT